MKQTLVVGLTGQTGAGKSTVCDILRDEGFFIVDADKVARQVVEAGSKCIMDIALEFGCKFLNEDGTLNRQRLGSEVFSDKNKLIRLNEIMFPYIIEAIKSKIDEAKENANEIIILDAPTLFESGADKFCDTIVSVIASRAIRMHRIMHRDNLSETAAINRINSQHDNNFYTSRSWKIVDNSGDLDALRTQVDRLIVAIRTFDIRHKLSDY